MAAWKRVDAWYRAGNLPPEPELSTWRLHPEKQLRVLGAALRNDSWTPSKWLRLPYPKKGARLRHFVWPTVLDQVAFMTHMVLLAPLVDSALENFVFGNRWFRPRKWEKRGSTKEHWIRLPYPLMTAKAYLPYARDHGLFRRVASWTVSRMTGSRIDYDDDGGSIQNPKDYHADFLPPWTKENWWNGCRDGRAHWAALDLELAYPSVRLPYLRDNLRTLLDLLTFDPSILRGFPDDALCVLQDVSSRQKLAARMMDALERVDSSPTDIPSKSWRSPHAWADFDRDGDPGIPTGLAISGVLLNAALSRSDQSILRYLENTSSHDRGAIVRFADDMYVLSRSTGGLLALIEVVSRQVAGTASAKVLDPTWRAYSNLYLNFAKIRPDAVKKLIVKARKRAGWKRCRKCEVLEPPESMDMMGETLTLDSWWKQAGGEESKLGKRLMSEAVRRGQVSPFMTTLVERMSQIGRDTLSDRFGEGARARLNRLHELARFDIDDEQVRSDTRKVFAANRLATAWSPDDGRPPAADVNDIRTSVENAMESTPWKFSLWTAIVKVAVRVPTGSWGESGDSASWLQRQLRRVSGCADGADTCWIVKWPEKRDRHRRGKGWKGLYLSFHRAAFWQALRTVLTDLWRAQARAQDRSGGEGERPERWTTRVVRAGELDAALELLADTDRWVEALYRDEDDYRALVRRPWELGSIVSAVLAGEPRSDVARAWMECAGPTKGLCVPVTLSRINGRTLRLLECAGRLSPVRTPGRNLVQSDLAHVFLAGSDRTLGTVLFPESGESRIYGWETDRLGTVLAGVALGCSRAIGSGIARPALPTTSEVPGALRGDLSLSEYAAVRRVLMGQEPAA